MKEAAASPIVMSGSSWFLQRTKVMVMAFCTASVSINMWRISKVSYDSVEDNDHD